MPNVNSTRRFTVRRNVQNRIAVPMKCGTDTIATASFVSTAVATSGVTRLPMPKPLTEPTNPPAALTPRRNHSKALTICDIDLRLSLRQP
jgi:hypothetical protein